MTDSVTSAECSTAIPPNRSLRRCSIRSAVAVCNVRGAGRQAVDEPVPRFAMAEHPDWRRSPEGGDPSTIGSARPRLAMKERISGYVFSVARSAL